MQLFRETQDWVLMSFSWEGKACLGVGSKENFSHRWVFPHSNYFIQSTLLNKKFKMGEKLENEKSSSSYLLFFSAFLVENAGIICRHCWQEKKARLQVQLMLWTQPMHLNEQRSTRSRDNLLNFDIFCLFLFKSTQFFFDLLFVN